jgi:threonine dehydrogenase-like Zn-dependent dehydrogenase
VVLEPREPPAPAPGELLLEPELVGLCGTDLEVIAGTIDPAYVRYPVVIGHEWTGRVAVGPGPAGSPPAGARVAVEGIVYCGHCLRCRSGDTNVCESFTEIGFSRDGAAAGHVAAPLRQVHVLAPGVSAQDAALIEPASVVFRALDRAGVTPGCRALVVGDGTVALLGTYLLGLWSPAEVTVLGRREVQSGLASTAGAAAFVTDRSAAGTGFDLVVEAAGTADAAGTAFAAARRGGTVVLLGLPPQGEPAPVSAGDLVTRDLTIVASFSYTSRAFQTVVQLLNADRLRPGFLVTHCFALDDWEAALATLRGADGPRGKVLLRIGG